MVWIHLWPWENFGQFHFCELQVSVRVFNVHQLAVRTYGLKLVCRRCSFSRDAVSELAWISFDVYGLVGMVQKCLSIAEQTVWNWLLSLCIRAFTRDRVYWEISGLNARQNWLAVAAWYNWHHAWLILATCNVPIHAKHHSLPRSCSILLAKTNITGGWSPYSLFALYPLKSLFKCLFWLKIETVCRWLRK